MIIQDKYFTMDQRRKSIGKQTNYKNFPIDNKSQSNQLRVNLQLTLVASPN